MLIFVALVILLLPLSVSADSSWMSPPPPQSSPQGGNITVIPNPLGASYWSSNGGHVDVIGKEPGTQMYFSHDRYGNPNGSGYINQPFRDRPLTLPPSRSRTER